MSAYEQLTRAQNGQVIDNLAAQFGLSHAETEDAIREMLPVLTRAVQANIQTKRGLQSLIRALGSGHHARYYDDPATIGAEETLADGRAIARHMLGSDRQVRALETQAQYATGLGGGILEQILPHLASILMGMIFKRGGPEIGREFNRGGYSRTPDIQGFPRMPDTGGGGGYRRNDVPEPEYDAPAPYDEIANELDRRGRNPGGFTGGIRDAIGKSLGGRGGGIMGWIIKFVVLRYGWRILRGVIAAFLGRR
ncbi:MAG: DUF937 domain-containing protein [Pseudomonadota bacterium]